MAVSRASSMPKRRVPFPRQRGAMVSGWPVANTAMVLLADGTRRLGRHDDGLRQLAEPRHGPLPPPPPSPLALLALGAALLIAFDPAQAAETARRLQIDIDLKRDGNVQQGAETGKGKLVEQLASDRGAPFRRHADDEQPPRPRTAGANSSVPSAASRSARGPAKCGSTPAAAPDVAAMQARAQQMMAKCGQDRECLMREASAMSAAQVAGGDKATQAKLQAYGQAASLCERQSGKAKEACQADARRKAGGGEDEPDEVVENPYLMFTGRANCRLEAKIRIDNRVEGSFADVQGMVPYTETAQAQQTRREDMYCPMLQVVLDQRNGRVWTHVMAIDSANGVSVRSEKGRAPQKSEGPMALRWMEAEKWVQQRLSNLSAGGEDKVRVPVAGGQAEATMRWRFEPI